jgi:hypothetical protein
MKSLAIPLAGAGLAILLAVGATSGATPAPAATSAPVATLAPAVAPAVTPAPAAATTGVVAAILGLTDAEVMAFRAQGLSLAQIADKQKVDPQKLIDALAAQWSVRIDARLAAGALTADQASALKANVAVQAKAMVYQATLGGMRGAAVGAGPNGTTRGMGAGGMGGRGAAANGGRMGAGRGGMMAGTGAGTGTCPYVSPAPSATMN